MEQKESARLEWQKKIADISDSFHWGKAAEKLRRQPRYREAATVFATPHKSLLQARINSLVDGKNLLMPDPGIREGFLLLAPHSIPFKDISLAVTYKGLEKYGAQQKADDISGLAVDLLLTDALAVDASGGRLGDGHGFFDLCCAILQDLGALAHDAAFLAFIQKEQIAHDLLPQDLWDIKMTGAVTPEQILQFDPPPQRPQIFWDMLPHDRIKRIDPLWKLYRKREEKGESSN